MKKQKRVQRGRIRHGLSYHKLYPVWSAMIVRCRDPKSKVFKHYGGRGITVCDRWKDLSSFLEDMEMNYFKGAVLDRKDNSKGYSKDNCRWITQRENMSNTRVNHIVELNGKKQSIAAWAIELNLNYGTLSSRIKRGMSPEKALNPKLYGKPYPYKK